MLIARNKTQQQPLMQQKLYYGCSTRLDIRKGADIKAGSKPNRENKKGKAAPNPLARVETLLLSDIF